MTRLSSLTLWHQVAEQAVAAGDDLTEQLSDVELTTVTTARDNVASEAAVLKAELAALRGDLAGVTART